MAGIGLKGKVGEDQGAIEQVKAGSFMLNQVEPVATASQLFAEAIGEDRTKEEEGKNLDNEEDEQHQAAYL